jgi:hypothetical protein
LCVAASLRAFDERDLSMTKTREVIDGSANTERVVDGNPRTPYGAAVSTDRHGRDSWRFTRVELINSSPSTPRSQRASTRRRRSSGDQRRVAAKDVYPLGQQTAFEAAEYRSLESVAENGCNKSDMCACSPANERNSWSDGQALSRIRRHAAGFPPGSASPRGRR